MKINIELDITPEEAQNLFIPSDKQKEFASALYAAYIDALSKAAGTAFNNTLGKVIKKRKD